MKALKITYWITTALFSVVMLSSGIAYFAVPDLKANFAHTGFPDFFRIELGIAKIIGVPVLILPFFKGAIKEWAYSGYFIVLVSAFFAHLSINDPANNMASPLLFGAILGTSYYCYKKLQAGQPS